MKRSPKICAHTCKKKENLHSRPAAAQDDPYMKCTWPSRCTNAPMDCSKSNAGERVCIEASKRDLSIKSGSNEKSRSYSPKKPSEQSSEQAGTEKRRLNERNGEQNRCLVRLIGKQEGKCAAVEGKKLGGDKTESSPPRGSHWSQSTVRRYALYRSMLKSSAKVDPNKSESKRESRCVNQSGKSGVRKEGTSPERLGGLSRKERPLPPQTDCPLIVDNVVPLDFTRGFDLKGTQFPKRIYIREYVNDAIVDELVDVRNEEDWDLLTYMAPLRPITVDTADRPRDLRFQDLRDFDVYCYPFDWRRLVDQ